MKNLGRMRWICTVMIGLIVVLGLETAALAYPSPPSSSAPAVEAPFAAMAARVAPPTARFVRGPHLVAREAHRQLSPAGPVIQPPVHLAADPAQQHLVAGSVLTTVSVVLLVNFLWMVVVGAIWFFGFYVPVASTTSDVAFPPQAALFFVSFGFLVPGLILLPTGLQELKVYRAMESAELGPVDGRRPQPSAFAAGCQRPGGWTLVRF